MARTASPLRYPGGKSTLLSLTASILRTNGLERIDYAEPYAGGCGLALSLLYGGHVSDIHINDIDAGIWAFWKCVLDQTDELAELIMQAPVTVDEWHRQREIHQATDRSDRLALGFSTFFLNRTNRSGIIKGGGVIGGLEQTGNYKIDCRFNRENLVDRIRRVKKYRSQIHLTNFDALTFLRRCKTRLPEYTFYCIDPPYFKKGSSLYTSFYKENDHADLAETVLEMESPWIVTYDDVPQIRGLYRDRRQYSFDINYSVQTKRIGTELLIASKGLKVPADMRQRQVNRPQYRAA
jgi:DNA adenine methylase